MHISEPNEIIQLFSQAYSKQCKSIISKLYKGLLKGRGVTIDYIKKEGRKNWTLKYHVNNGTTCVRQPTLWLTVESSVGKTWCGSSKRQNNNFIKAPVLLVGKAAGIWRQVMPTFSGPVQKLKLSEKEKTRIEPSWVLNYNNHFFIFVRRSSLMEMSTNDKCILLEILSVSTIKASTVNTGV